MAFLQVGLGAVAANVGQCEGNGGFRFITTGYLAQLFATHEGQQRLQHTERQLGQVDQIDQPDLAMKEEGLAEQLHQKQEIQAGFFHSLRSTGQNITRRSVAL
ncbi:hypothetical protein D3C85_1619700 [compost metagenome]